MTGAEPDDPPDDGSRRRGIRPAIAALGLLVFFCGPGFMHYLTYHRPHQPRPDLGDIYLWNDRGHVVYVSVWDRVTGGSLIVAGLGIYVWGMKDLLAKRRLY